MKRVYVSYLSYVCGPRITQSDVRDADHRSGPSDPWTPEHAFLNSLVTGYTVDRPLNATLGPERRALSAELSPSLWLDLVVETKPVTASLTADASLHAWIT
jgi:hypothetical protein